MTTNTISITVKKSKLAENGDYNLTADRYRETVDYSNAKWPMVELGEVCDLVRGITYGKDDEVEENGLKVLRANNINLDSSLNFEDIKQISINIKLSEDKKLRKDDIFICLASGSKSHIGKVAFVENDTDYYFGGFMGVIRTNQEKQAISKYIFQQLKSSKFNDYLRKEISGVNINNLNSKILSTYKIPLPPLSIQEQIVTEIEQYQKVIDGAKQVVQNWKPSFRIDPSWEVVELGEVCEIQRGGSPRPIDDYITKDEDGINWIKIGDVPEGDKYITKTKQKIKKEGLSKTRLVKDGDFILSNSMSFGRPYIVKIAGAIHDGWLLIRINDQKQITSDFLYQILGSDFLKEQYSRLATGGVVRNLNSEIVRGVKIPLPPLSIQKQIVAEIEAEQRVVNSNKELMEKMQKKVEAKIGEVWGEEMK